MYCQGADPETNAIVESDQSLLLKRGVCVARGIVCLGQRKSLVLVNTFTEEYFNNGACIAFLKENQEARFVIAIADFQRKSKNAFKPAHYFGVNPALCEGKQEKGFAMEL